MPRARCAVVVAQGATPRNDIHDLIMPAPRRSKRFHPNALTEKFVPVILALLLLILLAVLIITILSLVS